MLFRRTGRKTEQERCALRDPNLGFFTSFRFDLLSVEF